MLQKLGLTSDVFFPVLAWRLLVSVGCATTIRLRLRAGYGEWWVMMGELGLLDLANLREMVLVGVYDKTV